MQINIESLNKEVFKIALNEEIERQSFNQKNNSKYNNSSDYCHLFFYMINKFIKS